MGIWAAAAGTLCILSFDIGAARGKADPPLIESLKPIEGRSRDAFLCLAAALGNFVLQ